MREYLKKHIKFIEKALKKKEKGFDWKTLQEFHRTRISFFQHERLIHLWITLFFGLLFLVITLVNLWLANAGLLILGVILLVVLIFYVLHYFYLENNVQKLYFLDDEISKRLSKRKP